MIQIFTIYSLFFLVTALVSFFGAFLAWQRRKVKGALEITWLMIASGIGAFWIIFETAAPTVTEKLLWSKLEFIGGVWTPVLYLIFVLRFTGKDKFLSAKHIISYLIVPLITLVLILTNDKHGLIWTGFSAISSKTNLMEYYHGICFWIGYIAYSYIMLLIGTIYIFSFIFRHKKSFRYQGWVILIGGLLPWTASFCYLTGINITPGLDLAPASIALSGILLIYAIFHDRLLDLVPIARETLVETLKDGIIALDSQNRIQDVNEAALSYLGISNKNILGFFVNTCGASVIPLINAVVKEGLVDQVEIQVGDNLQTFSVIKQTIKNQPGSRLIIIRDISDYVSQQKEILAVEERYRKLSQLFRLMADNMPDMLWAKDLNKKFIFTNKAICDNLLKATDTEEPIGKTEMFFLDRERSKYPNQKDWNTFGQMFQDSDKEVINSGKPTRYEEFGNVNGNFLYLDIRKDPIFNEKGVMIGVVGSARDVTIQKMAESDIHKRDILLDAIAKATALLVKNEDIEDSIEGVLEILGCATEVNRVYIFQNHSDPRYDLPLTSQRFEWTNGLVEPQINNPNLQNISYEPTLLRWMEKLLAGNVISGKVSEFPESEKEILLSQDIKSLLAAPIFVDSYFWGFIGFDDCFHEREWLPAEEQILAAAANTIGAAYFRKINRDELIKAKERAEESDRLKSAFLANMSHEIRTPMNGILGFTELLKEPKLTGEEQQEYISIMEKSGNRMLNIINDIISISKLETGLVKANLSDVDVNEQLDFIYKFFKPQAEEKNIKMTLIKILSEEEAKIRTDKEKVYTVLTNLTKNAIKFAPSGSIEIGCNRKPAGVEFFVKDTGIGILPEQKYLIFERFRQGSESFTRNYEGAGLGLSISKAYVELLGGRIWVESEPGKGSIFYFTIPDRRS